MAFISLIEIFRLAVVSVVIGYILKDIAPRQMKVPDISEGEHLDISHVLGANPKYSDLMFAIMVTAPAVVFHELAHKFMAMGFGLQSVVFASYEGLAIGVAMKVLLGWMVFIPAYAVSYGLRTPLQDAAIAFAGPLLNLILWQGSMFMLKKGYLSKHAHALGLTARINKILFFFNMIPFPPFDGFSVVRGLFRTLF